MRAANLFKRVLLVAAPLVWLIGCDSLTDSQDGPDPSATDWEAATDLTSDYGGYTFSDEKPAFDDPEVAKIDGEENLVPLEVDDPEMQRARFALRILWGQLRGNRNMMQGSDWSGGIAVSSGALGVLHTIGFEMRDQVLPRENRQQLRFMSRTQTHMDGLLLAIHEDGDDAATLTFESGPFRHTWRLSELRGIDTLIAVDDLGNAISLQAIEVDAECPRGFVRGHWLKREGAERGVFRGLWATTFGRPVGHIRGHFGVNDQGERLWFGKIIDRQGRVIGLARGHWVPSDDAALPGGTFQGHWAARQGERTGGVGGHYLPTRDSERGIAGFFAGRWGTDCEEPPAVP